MSRVRLPTAAPHVTVVPGDFWALIEKGPVQGIGSNHAPYMATSSMVLVPEAWLTCGQEGDRPHKESKLDEDLAAACELL